MALRRSVSLPSLSPTKKELASLRDVELPSEGAWAASRSESHRVAANVEVPKDVVAQVLTMMKHSSRDVHNALRRKRAVAATDKFRKRRARNETELLPGDVLVGMVKGSGVCAETIAAGCTGALQRRHGQRSLVLSPARLRTARPGRFLLAPPAPPKDETSGPPILGDDGQLPTKAIKPSRASPDSDGDMDVVYPLGNDDLWDAFCQPGHVPEAAGETGDDEDGIFSQPSPIPSSSSS